MGIFLLIVGVAIDLDVMFGKYIYLKFVSINFEVIFIGEGHSFSRISVGPNIYSQRRFVYCSPFDGI